MTFNNQKKKFFSYWIQGWNSIEKIVKIFIYLVSLTSFIWLFSYLVEEKEEEEEEDQKKNWIKFKNKKKKLLLNEKRINIIDLNEFN